MNGIIYLEDGSVYMGKGFGKQGTAVGELVFNTSITGYQEVLTDPSYAGQVIMMTYPLIGNYGVSDLENESPKSHAKGFIVKSISNSPSNHMCDESLTEMLEKMNIVGVYDVDTRGITKKIRSKGVLKCVISNEQKSVGELEELLNNTPSKNDWMNEVGTKKPITLPGKGLRVALIDFGVKQNIINSLRERDCHITILPATTSYEEIMKLNPQGVLLSNGPGDPKEAIKGIETVKKLIGNVPIFGICMGHQVLALAIGADTYKMKYGHRGGNHGVYDINRDRAYITSQNHGYAIDQESLNGKDYLITHINLNDDTIEGIQHKSLPIYSVQFHPEGSPGPTDSSYLFDKFIKIMEVNSYAIK